MNPIITRELLEEAGVQLGDQDVDALLLHLNQTLEERVGAEITESLPDEKLKELLEVQDGGDDEAVGAWISANVPELEEITQDEIDILIGELVESADDINQAA